MPDDLHAQLAIAQRREAALAGVLRVVANSGGDLSQLMHGIADNARLLCAADVVGLFRFEGDHIAWIGSMHGEHVASDPAAAEDSILTRVLRERVVVRFDDQSTVADEAYAYSRKVAADVGFKSAAYVPVPGEGEAVGINALRATITPFTDDEVELLQTFAVQVGNALDAAKQRREIEQRNAELTAALTLQAATSEVLRLISTNPGDLSVVLDGILTKAADLCGADAGTVMVSRGDVVRAEAAIGPFADLRGLSTPPARVTLQARDRRAAVRDRRRAAGRRPDHVAAGAALRSAQLRERCAVRRRGVDRQHQPQPLRGAPVRPGRRSRSCSPSPTRPRSPSRTRGCSTTSTTRSPASRR